MCYVCLGEIEGGRLGRDWEFGRDMIVAGTRSVFRFILSAVHNVGYGGYI